MSKHLGSTSIDRIFVMLQRAGITADEGDVIEWTGEALEAIGAITQYEEAVCFLKVESFKATVPNGFHAILQLARNNCYTDGYNASCATVADVVSTYNPIEDEGEAHIPVALNELGEPVNAYELAYYRPFFDLQYNYVKWTASSLYGSCFTPIRLTENVFFNSIVCKEADYDHIYHNCKDEYNIKENKILTFSFQEGQVALAYMRQQLDSNGYPMIPDHISYTKAILEYIRWQVHTREFYTGRQGAQARMEVAEREWIWYCGQASNESMMIKGIDEHQNFLDQRSYIIPPRNKTYNSFFGNMNQPENRRYLRGR